MAKIIWIDEHFKHFLNDLKDSFWGDLEAKTRLAWKQFFEADSERMRSLYMGVETYERDRVRYAGPHPRIAVGVESRFWPKPVLRKWPGTVVEVRISPCRIFAIEVVFDEFVRRDGGRLSDCACSVAEKPQRQAHAAQESTQPR